MLLHSTAGGPIPEEQAELEPSAKRLPWAWALFWHHGKTASLGRGGEIQRQYRSATFTKSSLKTARSLQNQAGLGRRNSALEILVGGELPESDMLGLLLFK